jgi:hypothetical protein
MVMGRRRIAFLVGLLVLAGMATLVPSPLVASVGEADTCQLATGTLEQSLIAIHTRSGGPVTRIELELHISASGDAEASGTVGITNGTSNTIMVAERRSWQVSCADLDGDNLRGIVKVTGSLEDVRTREPFVVVIMLEQEVEASGFYTGVIEITSADGRTTSTPLHTLFVREHHRLSG